MRDFNLLYGFNSEQTSEKIAKALKALGYKANASMRPSKPLIKDFILKQRNLDAVVLKEYLDGGDVFSIDELVELTDECNVNFVVLLSSSYRGTDDMKKLYSAGILNVYFLDGKTSADPLKVAELATAGRVRKEAREYYKIEDVVIDRSLLTYSEYRDNYKYLINQSVGLNIVDRFVTISRWLSPHQMAKFINMLPDKVLSILMKYEEYYVIQTKLFRARCMPTKQKKPKDVQQALPEGYMMELLSQDRGTYTRQPERVPEPVAVRTDSYIEASDNAYRTYDNDYPSYGWKNGDMSQQKRERSGPVRAEKLYGNMDFDSDWEPATNFNDGKYQEEPPVFNEEEKTPDVSMFDGGNDENRMVSASTIRTRVDRASYSKAEEEEPAYRGKSTEELIEMFS